MLLTQTMQELILGLSVLASIDFSKGPEMIRVSLCFPESALFRYCLAIFGV